MTRRSHRVSARPSRSLLASCVFAIVAMTAAAPVLANPVALPRGDVNQDGRYDAGDVLALTRHLRGDSGADLSENEKALYAADLAPLGSNGAIKPDKQVNASDLLLLIRLIRGDPSPAAPTLNLTTPPNPNGIGSVSGSAPAGSTVHLFASNASGTVVHIDSCRPTSVSNCDSYTFTSVPMLFEGVNNLFTVAVGSNGFASFPSPIQTISFTSPGSVTCQNTTAVTIAQPTVWTAHCGEYALPQGLTVNSELYLGPGVVLRFDSGKSAQVNGLLRANGAFGGASQRVRFLTSSSPGSTWAGINGTSAGQIVLSRVLIQSAVVGIQSAGLVVLQQSTVTAPSGGGDGVIISGSGTGTLGFNELIGAGRNLSTRTGVLLDFQFNVGPPQGASVLTGNLIRDFGRCVESRWGLQPRLQQNNISTCQIGVQAGANTNSASPLFIGFDNRIEQHSIAGIDVYPTYAPSGLCNDVVDGLPQLHLACWLQPYIPEIHGNIFRGNAKNIRTHSPPSGSPRALHQVLLADGNDWGDGYDTPDPISASIQDMSSGGVDLLVGFTPFRDPGTTNLIYTWVIGDLSCAGSRDWAADSNRFWDAQSSVKSTTAAVSLMPLRLSQRESSSKCLPTVWLRCWATYTRSGQMSIQSRSGGSI